MAAPRIKTRYTGVFYREARRIGKSGWEKVFYILFKQDGKVIEEKVGREKAEKMTPIKASKIRAQRIEGELPSPKERRTKFQETLQAVRNRWTFDKIWREYLASKPDLKGIVTDRNRYEKHLQPMLGRKEPKDLVYLDIERLKRKLMKDHKPGTVKNVMELLRRLINFASKKELCPTPSFIIEMPRVNNLKTEDLIPDQLKRLLQTLESDKNRQIANLMLMALYTGMRRGELFRLQWADIDFERGFINIREPKGGTDQRIPLNDQTRSLLIDHPRSGNSPYVFPGRGGNQRVCIKHQVNRIKEAAGLPKDFRALHGLRHVYASMVASSGQVDMYTLQKLLTHKSPFMTQRYAHLRDDALLRASNIAGNLIDQSMELDEDQEQIS